MKIKKKKKKKFQKKKNSKMKIIWLITIIIYIGYIFSSISSQCPWSTGPQILPPAYQAQLNGLLASLDGDFQKVNISGGFHVSVLYNGTLLMSRGYGYARVDVQEPPTSTDYFRLG